MSTSTAAAQEITEPQDIVPERQLSTNGERRARIEMAQKQFVKELNERRADFQLSLKQIDSSIDAADKEYLRSTALLQQALTLAAGGKPADVPVEAFESLAEMVTPWMQHLGKYTDSASLPRDEIEDDVIPIRVVPFVVDEDEEEQEEEEKKFILQELQEDWQVNQEKLGDRVDAKAVNATIAKIQTLLQQWDEEAEREKKLEQDRKDIETHILQVPELDKSEDWTPETVKNTLDEFEKIWLKYEPDVEYKLDQALTPLLLQIHSLTRNAKEDHLQSQSLKQQMEKLQVALNAVPKLVDIDKLSQPEIVALLKQYKDVWEKYPAEWEARLNAEVQSSVTKLDTLLRQWKETSDLESNLRAQRQEIQFQIEAIQKKPKPDRSEQSAILRLRRELEELQAPWRQAGSQLQNAKEQVKLLLQSIHSRWTVVLETALNQLSGPWRRALAVQKKYQTEVVALMDELRETWLLVLNTIRDDRNWPWREAGLAWHRAQSDIYNLLLEERSKWILAMVNQRHEWQEDIDLQQYSVRVENQVKHLQQLKQNIEELQRLKIDLIEENAKQSFKEFEKWEELLKTDRAVFEVARQEYEQNIKEQALMNIDPQDWPRPLNDQFAFDILSVLPPEEYGMEAPDISKGSRCRSDVPVEEVMTEAQEAKQSQDDIKSAIDRMNVANVPISNAIQSTAYQRAIGQMNHPALKQYHGLLWDWSVGSGKSRGGMEAILTWYLNAGAATDTYRQVLVLLPNTRSFGTWTDELRKFPALYEHFVPPAFSWANHVHTLQWTFDNGFQVILQSMTGALPIGVYNRWVEATPQGETPDTITFAARKLVARESYSKNPIYSQLRPSVLTSLDAELRRTAGLLVKQQQRYKSDRLIALPPHGLMFVDEAQDLANPGSKLKRAEQSNAVLAWAMTIKYSKTVRKNILSGTPLHDESRLMDYFRLINLVKDPDQMDQRLPEGVWRRVLSATAQREEAAARKGSSKSSSNATEQAELAEQNFIKTLYFNDKEQWRSPLVKQQFQHLITGLYSYISLVHDVTVYPQLDLSCPLSEHGKGPCMLTFVRDDSADKGFRLVPQAKLRHVASGDQKSTDFTSTSHFGSTEIFVPLEQNVFKNYLDKLKVDLKQYSSYRLQIPECEDTEPNAVCLKYGDQRLKTAVQHGWGFKSSTVKGKNTHSGKFEVLQMFLERFSKDKHFVYSSATQFLEYAKFFNEHFIPQGYELFGMVEALNYMISALPKNASKQKLQEILENVDQLVQDWYDDPRNKPGKRYMFFGASTQKVNLDAALKRAERFQIDDTVTQVVMSGIYNHRENRDGKYMQMFVGDFNAMTTLSLKDTQWVHLLNPGATLGEQTQSTARVLRYCALAREPDMRKWKVHVLSYISTAPVQATFELKTKATVAAEPKKKRTYAKRQPKEAVKPASRKRASGGKRASGKRASGKRVVNYEEEEESTEYEGGQEEQKVSVPGMIVKMNEQYQLEHLSQVSSVGEELLRAAQEAAYDCQLNRDYNSTPDRQLQCFGSAPPPTGAPVAERRRNRKFQLCASPDVSTMIIDQPGNTPTIVLRAVRQPEQNSSMDAGNFAQVCQDITRAKPVIQNLTPYSYWDELLLLFHSLLKELEAEWNAEEPIVPTQRGGMEALHWLLTVVPDAKQKSVTNVKRLLGRFRALTDQQRPILHSLLENKRTQSKETAARVVENQNYAKAIWRLYQREQLLEQAATRALQQYEARPAETEFQNLAQPRRSASSQQRRRSSISRSSSRSNLPKQ